MMRVDIIPDWIVLVLAVALVGGVFKLFGGVGVLVLAIICTVIWIAQVTGNAGPRADQTRSKASGPASDASSPSRPR
jgi:hypothetical protein